MIDLLSIFLIAGGLFFYCAGTVGLLRLPDTLSRLHAVTKADNLGLGLLVLGIAIQIGDPLSAIKVLLIWLLVLAASAVGGQLIAQHVVEQKEETK